ncbi:MAG: hypothetical protein Q4A59_02075, partial [Erysipelotrichaceae bacterium]|nr:hypothetical protein [Erysipelotrichaceae bacterium]
MNKILKKNEDQIEDEITQSALYMTQNEFYSKKIISKNTIDKARRKLFEKNLKNTLALLFVMWLNSRALTERQASEGKP